MRAPSMVVYGLSLALVFGAPAHAWQHRGGQQGGPPASGQQGQAAPVRSADRQIYGWQLMTPEERDAYRAQMRGTHTQQERDALRMQHHEEMRKRAAERGVTLPDMPRAGAGPHGRGMGPGAQPPVQTQQQTQQRVEQQTQQQTQPATPQRTRQQTEQQTQQQPEPQRPQ